MHLKKCRAQSLIEYVTLISIVTIALTVLFPLVKRVVQSVVKTGADQIGEQPKELDDLSKALQESTTSTSRTVSNTITQGGGQVTYGVDETTTTEAKSSTFLDSGTQQEN